MNDNTTSFWGAISHSPTHCPILTLPCRRFRGQRLNTHLSPLVPAWVADLSPTVLPIAYTYTTWLKRMMSLYALLFLITSCVLGLGLNLSCSSKYLKQAMRERFVRWSSITRSSQLMFFGESRGSQHRVCDNLCQLEIRELEHEQRY